MRYRLKRQRISWDFLVLKLQSLHRLHSASCYTQSTAIIMVDYKLKPVMDSQHISNGSDTMEKSIDSSKVDTSGHGTPIEKGSVHDISSEENVALDSRITRKIDMRLVPMLCMLYLTAYLDRTNIGNARLYGLEKELSMPSNGYNTAIWTFFLTFVLMEVPSNVLMNHSGIPPNWWLGVSMTLLGIVTMAQGFVTNSGGLYACRAIMGIFEGSLTPAAALMMGSYYRKNEFALRYTCFTTSALIGASFSSVRPSPSCLLLQYNTDSTRTVPCLRNILHVGRSRKVNLALDLYTRRPLQHLRRHLHLLRPAPLPRRIHLPYTR